MEKTVKNGGQKKPPRLVPNIDFDGTWKDIIEQFLPNFIAFFLPKLHELIDYSVPPTYLDKELQHILESKGYKKKTTDKLIKMQLKNGESKWILLHIEVQSYFEKLFGRRMFIIFSWLFSKYNESLVALVIYTSDKVPKVFDHFEEESIGTKVRFDFNAYLVMKQKEADLLASDNIFALFVLANKYVNETRAESQLPNRLRMKQKIYELAIEREIDKERIAKFLIFVDRIMLLPSDMNIVFDNFVKSNLKFVMGHKRILFSPHTPMLNALREMYKEEHGYDIVDIKQENKELSKVRKELSKENKDLEKTLKSERRNVEKERINAEKERINAEKEREKIVLKLHTQEWSAEKIADVLGYDLVWVEGVLKGKGKKK
jgi:hypothetical protein